MKRLALPLALVGFAGLFLTACNPPAEATKDSTTGTTGQPAANGKITIAMIPKGTSHVFWKSVEAGAKKAATELGVEVIWKGPLKEDDKDGQVKVVEDFTAKKVSAIGLAPLDNSVLRVPVTNAQDAKIPVLIFDSGLKDVDTVSFVATDNKAAGKMGGEKLAKVMGGKGKVILLRYMEGSASTMEREEGFLEAMKANPGITVISDNQHAGASVESAQQMSENLLQRFKDVEGIFCPNESAAFGMLRALQNAGLAGKIKFVGFDASDQLLAGVEKGEIDALVVQNPEKMGYLSVKTLVAYLKGEKVEKRIDTGAAVVDKENMKTPEINDILHPKL